MKNGPVAPAQVGTFHQGFPQQTFPQTSFFPQKAFCQPGFLQQGLAQAGYLPPIFQDQQGFPGHGFRIQPDVRSSPTHAPSTPHKKKRQAENEEKKRQEEEKVSHH
jgi:hypothetical protein